MKKNLFIVALAAMSLASCSNDEVVEVQKDAIRFNLAVDNASRAVMKTATLYEFKVYSYATTTAGTKALYFSEVATGSSAAGFATTNTYYWPAAGEVDFYGIYPTSYTLTDGKTIADYTVPAAAGEDLLYALTAGQQKQNTAVAMNFRHALSQIIYTVKLADDAKLKVQVSEVSLCNLANKATLTMPTASTTTNNYSSADNGSETELTDGTWGTWSTPEGTASYTASATAVTVTSYPSASAVKTVDFTTRDNGLLLMPQTVATAGSYVEGTGWTGLYMKVKCNICAPSAGETADIQIFPATSGEFAEIYVPITVAWKQGVIYKYNLIFGNTGDTPKDENNDPIYEAIKFTVTVDEFQSATTTGTDVDME